MASGEPALLEIVVPAYNEAQRLPHGLALLGERLATLPIRAAVIVVDNGSTDGTAQLVREWSGPVPLRLLECPQRGKGAAVRTGLLATRARFVGYCDADMATDLSSLDTVLDLLFAGHQVVVGSRRHPESVVEDRSHPLRKLGAVTFNLLIRDLADGIADTQCGFKFFDGALGRAAAAALSTTGFAFDVELLMHCVRQGAGVTSVPVIWHDVPGSTFSVRRHSLPVLRDLTLLRLAGLRRAAYDAAASASTSASSSVPAPLPTPVPASGPAPQGQAAYGQAAYGQAAYGQAAYGPAAYGQVYAVTEGPGQGPG